MFIWTVRNLQHGNYDGILILWIFIALSLYFILAGHKNIVKRKKKQGCIMIILGLVTGIFICWLQKFL